MGFERKLLTVSNLSVDPLLHSTSSMAPLWFLRRLLTKPRGSIDHNLPSVPRFEVKISSTLSQSAQITKPLLECCGIPKCLAGSVWLKNVRSPTSQEQSSATPPVDFPERFPASHIRCLNAP